MAEIQEPGSEEQSAPPRRPDEPRVRHVLLVQFALCVALALLGTMLFSVIALSAGWGLDFLQAPFSETATAPERWRMRLMVAISHFTTFILAGFGTVWLFYRGSPYRAGDWPDYLRSRQVPNGRILGLAILLMLVSLPLVLYSYTINKALPLPESLRMMEDQTTEIIKGLLQMDNVWELLANLLIIALLPALGEELVFRGVLQQQLLRRMANPWVALFLSAAIFSFIHFQFEGFLPRLLLGLLLGWLYWQTRNFWVPVAAHFFNNALQVVGQYLYGRELSTVDLEQDIEVPWYYAVGSLFLIWVVVRLIRKSTAAEPTQRAFH